MKGHKIYFYGKMWLIIHKLSLLPFLFGALNRNSIKASAVTGRNILHHLIFQLIKHVVLLIITALIIC